MIFKQIDEIVDQHLPRPIKHDTSQLVFAVFAARPNMWTTVIKWHRFCVSKTCSVSRAEMIWNATLVVSCKLPSVFCYLPHIGNSRALHYFIAFCSVEAGQIVNKLEVFHLRLQTNIFFSPQEFFARKRLVLFLRSKRKV